MSGGGNEVKSGSMTLSTTTSSTSGGKASSSSTNQRSTGAGGAAAESEVTAEQLNELDEAVTVCQQRLSEARAARGAAETELTTLQKRFKSIDSEVHIPPTLLTPPLPFQILF